MVHDMGRDVRRLGVVVGLALLRGMRCSPLLLVIAEGGLVGQGKEGRIANECLQRMCEVEYESYNV